MVNLSNFGGPSVLKLPEQGHLSCFQVTPWQRVTQSQSINLDNYRSQTMNSTMSLFPWQSIWGLLTRMLIVEVE